MEPFCDREEQYLPGGLELVFRKSSFSWTAGIEHLEVHDHLSQQLFNIREARSPLAREIRMVKLDDLAQLIARIFGQAIPRVNQQTLRYRVPKSRRKACTHNVDGVSYAFF